MKSLAALTAPSAGADELPRGNAAAGFAPVLARLGLRSTDERSVVEDALAEALLSRGLEGQLVSMRYHVATVFTDPQTAALLAYDRTHLLTQVNAAITAAGGTALTSLNVTTRLVPDARQGHRR